MGRALANPLDIYLRVEKLPTLWCPGCGIGIATQALLKAIDRRIREGFLRKDQIVFVGGIGCSSRVAMYVKFDSIRTAHGRAIPLATAIKIVKPDRRVIVVGGDGDIAGIGGNHLLHAIRRNMDLMVIVINNMIYAMTGGQHSPTTPPGIYTTTTPEGSFERPLNLIKLAWSLGANYVARGSVTHPQLLEQIFYKGLERRGFILIEVISTCPEVFGRHIGLRDAVELYRRLRDKMIVKKNPSIDESEYDWEKGFVLGVFVDREEKGYIDHLRLLRKDCMR
ncbi:MAG: thiamine pyrophosphate-dependent enzyme [Sulfolobales archaeon]